MSCCGDSAPAAAKPGATQLPYKYLLKFIIVGDTGTWARREWPREKRRLLPRSSGDALRAGDVGEPWHAARMAYNVGPLRTELVAGPAVELLLLVSLLMTHSRSRSCWQVLLAAAVHGQALHARA